MILCQPLVALVHTKRVIDQWIYRGPCLPLASLSLFVPPLRLVSAALWQVVQRRVIKEYGLLEEFVTRVLETVPDLMSHRERVQLIMGLQARLVLELCRSDHPANPQTIQLHLNKMITSHREEEEMCDAEVEASVLNFCKLVPTLLEDPVEREHFFQKVFPEEFGLKYDSALQSLVWEFLSRLEKLLPTPTFEQTASWLIQFPSVLEEYVKSVYQPEPLKTLLQHHNGYGGLDINASSSVDEYILRSLSLPPIETVENSADPQIQTEPMQGFMDVLSHASSDNESEMPSLFESNHMENKLWMNLDKSVEVELVFEEGACMDEETTQRKCNLRRKRLQTKRVGCQKHKMCVTSQKGGAPCALHVDSHCPFSYMEEKKLHHHIEKLHPVEHSGHMAKGQNREEPPDSVPQYSEHSTEQSPKRSKRAKICSLCGKSFVEAKDLTIHMRSHIEQGPYQCTQCGEGFDHTEDLQKHQQNERCEKAVHNQSSMKAQTEEDNMSTTSVEDWTEVSEAYNTVPKNPTSSNAFPAQRRSYKEKPRSRCHVCSKTFSTSSSMRIHLKSQHGELPYHCLDCGESFKSKLDLTKHRAVCLQATRLLSCDECGETFELSEPNDNEEVNQQQLPRNPHPEASGLLASVENRTEILHSSSTAPQNPTILKVSLPNVGLYLTCLLCNETFENSFKMREHIILKHDAPLYMCIGCGESFTNLRDQLAHKPCLGKNIPDSGKCPVCRKKTSQSMQNQNTMSKEVDLERQQPDLSLAAGENEMEILQSCSTDIKFSDDLHQHQTNECEEVDFQRQHHDLREEVSPNLHPREDDPEDGRTSPASRENGTDIPQAHNTSPQIPTTSNRPGTQSTPADVVLPTWTGKCPLCHKTFRRNAYLIMHMRRHGQQGAFSCTQCSKSFACNRELRMHQANKRGCGPTRRNRTADYERDVSEDTPLFSCPHCINQYKSEKRLKTHMECHNTKGFSCKYCGKMFAEKSQLSRHIHIHTRIQHLCDTCGKDFGSAAGLNIHMRVHTGERPYPCTRCDKRFSSKGGLKDHQYIHTGERLYACTLCQARCVSNIKLRLHMIVHTREKPFKCVCGKAFRTKCYFKSHQKKCS